MTDGMISHVSWRGFYYPCIYKNKISFITVLLEAFLGEAELPCKCPCSLSPVPHKPSSAPSQLFRPLALLRSLMCCNKGRSAAASPCNIGSTFCLGQMPEQRHPSSSHPSSPRSRSPKSVFNRLENGRLHPCNQGIRAIRKINGPGNDVNQIHHDWNSITYVRARACRKCPQTLKWD